MLTTLEYVMNDDMKEKFQRAKYLTDVESCSDPETEPYKSLYEARQIWAELKNNLENVDNSSCDTNEYKASIGCIYYYIGVNYTDCGETSSGEEYLKKCVSILESTPTDKHACNVLQHAYNYLGILWANRRQPEKALESLKKAEKLYEDYNNEFNEPPLNLDESFTTLPESEILTNRESGFQNAYTKTTYYLAQVYTTLEQNNTAARYCHLTLQRQIQTEYDATEWAVNCATLSQFYLPENLSAARHCLASSTLVIESAQIAEDQNEGQDGEKFMRAVADLKRCWGKYVIALLETSKEKLFEALDEEKSVTEKETPEHKHFERFNLETDRFESEVTDQYLQNFSDARPVFLFGQKKLNEATKFYKLDEHCTDYIAIQQDLSQLYKGLSFFEQDTERQCKMEKRRIDILAPLVNQVNPQYYLLVCRQLMYEIAEIYSNMVDLKLVIIEQSKLNLHAAKKLNHLVRESISYYAKYRDSFKREDGSRIPNKLDSTDVRPYLIAVFCTGRLYTKLVPANTQERVSHLEKSVEQYKIVVEYCEKYEDARESVRAELELCKEMVELLPVKVEEARRNGIGSRS